MEIRKETTNEIAEKEGQDQLLEISFEGFKIGIYNTLDGVALIDVFENETFYRKNDIDNLIYFINVNTVSKITYINDNYNKYYRISRYYITLTDGNQYIIEVL